MQAWLGSTNYYCQFIQNHSKITAPLSRLTTSKIKWCFDDNCLEEFNKLKQKLHFHLITIYLITDASHVALAAVLAQIDLETRICLQLRVKASERQRKKLWYLFRG